MRTLCLDRDVWDWFLDVNGNWAVAENPYSIAQDAASAMRLFGGELYYDTSKGIPYLTQILGRYPSIPFLKSQFVTASLSVPETVSAVCYIASITDRLVTGQVQVTDSSGTVSLTEVSSIPLPQLLFDLDVSTLGGPDVLG